MSQGIRKDLDDLIYKLAHLAPETREALRLWDQYNHGELTFDEVRSHFRRLAKQKREREAKRKGIL